MNRTTQTHRAESIVILNCPQCSLPFSHGALTSGPELCPSCRTVIAVQDEINAETIRNAPHMRGRFECLDRVGAGSYGAVWKARDPKLGRLVALKLLHPSLIGSASSRERFLREAQTVARLRHPGIVPVHEVTELDGIPAIVSDLVQGVTLGELRHIRSLTFQEIAQVVRQVAEALEYAHSMGVIHRDVKPGNIMVEFPAADSDSISSDAFSSDSRAPGARSSGARSSGTRTSGTRTSESARILVLDFGLALHDEIGMTLTTVGQVIGTPAYMSPEQAAGKGHDVDRRSDIYSVGVVLYELLCRELPFRGHKAVLLEQVLREEPRAPRRIDRTIPRDLESICLRAMAKSPRTRYASARQLAEDLGRFIEGVPVKARPVRAPERVTRWCRRNPLLAILSGAVVSLLAIVAVVASLSAIRLDRERTATLDTLRSTYLAQAQALRFSGRAGRRFESLEVLAKAAAIRPGIDLRNEAIACLPLVDLAVEKVWPGRGPEREAADGIAFDGHFARCAVEKALGTGILILDPSDSTVIEELPSFAPHGASMEFSPDGRFLYTHTGLEGPYRIWDLEQHRKIAEGTDLSEGMLHVFAADGSRVVLGLRSGTVILLELPSGRELHHLELGRHPARVRLHPSGRSAAVLCDKDSGPTVLLDFDTKEVRDLLPAGSGRPLAWHPDGNRLAIGQQMVTEVIDITTGARVRMEGHQSIVMEGAFHPNGEILATRSWDGTTRLWDLSTGKELVNARGQMVRFDDRGDRLAFAEGGNVGWWKVASGRECRALRSRSEEGTGPWSIARHPTLESRWFATAHDDGTRVWDLQEDRELAHLETGWTKRVAFDSTGTRLLTAGEHGIEAWSLEIEEQTQRFQIGPRSTLVSPTVIGRSHVAISANGRWVAAPIRGRVLVIDLSAHADTFSLGPHLKVSHAAISPDGRWIATGGQFARDLRVWDVRTRALSYEVPSADVCAWGEFSPDGRWLATSRPGEPTEVRQVSTWKLQFQIPESFVPRGFSHDSRILVLDSGPGSMKLVSVGDGRELARLTAPDAFNASGLCFAPNGNWLATSCANFHLVQVWDLGAVRSALAPIGLDWDDSPPRQL